MLETGYTAIQIVQFLASFYPVSTNDLIRMLPKRGMSLMIAKTPTNQRVRIIKDSSTTYAIYIDMGVIV